MAAVLASAPAAASHWTAGWLWGLFRTNSAIHLTAPTRRHRRSEFRVHYAAVDSEDVLTAAAIPFTSLARTCSTSRRWSTASAWHGSSGTPRSCGTTTVADPSFTRSGLERRFRVLVRHAGLPLPASNYVVGRYEIAAYWEAERFGVELDVFATHGSRLSFQRDRERADDLLAMGIEIARVTDIRLAREPDAVMQRLAAHLDRRRRTPVFN